jgi:hypothetical protein
VERHRRRGRRRSSELDQRQTVALHSSKLAGERRIVGKRAVAIARRAVAGPDSALAAELVAYAGSPAKPRPARRAYVVQVTPRSQSGHLERSLCVVVDAETGEVLARWAGTAVPPASRQVKSAGPAARPVASTAQASGTVLFQLTNHTRQPGENNYAYGKLRLLVSTTGNPYSYRSDNHQFFDVFDHSLSLLAPWFEDVTRFVCVTRKFCGRDSGTAGVGGGDYNRWFLVGNHGFEKSEYRPSEEHLFIGSNDSDDPDIIAHEVGHAVDHRFDQGEYQQTIEGEEVKEALADMFSYDQDRDGKLQDGDTPATVSGSNPDDGLIVRDFANPANNAQGAGNADRYSKYSCTTTDEHHNGTILSHAYHRLVKKKGHAIAGHLLQYVPMALPARREFGDVREAFEVAARGLFPHGSNFEGSVEQKVDEAFGEVGIKDDSRRVDRCPSAKP